MKPSSRTFLVTIEKFVDGGTASEISLMDKHNFQNSFMLKVTRLPLMNYELCDINKTVS